MVREVLQIILAHWFALYDFNQDGRLQLEDGTRRWYWACDRSNIN